MTTSLDNNLEFKYPIVSKLALYHDSVLAQKASSDDSVLAQKASSDDSVLAQKASSDDPFIWYSSNQEVQPVCPLPNY